MERYWDPGVYAGGIIAGLILLAALGLLIFGLWVTFIETKTYFQDRRLYPGRMKVYEAEVKAQEEAARQRMKDPKMGRRFFDDSFSYPGRRPRPPELPSYDWSVLAPVSIALAIIAVVGGIIFWAGYPWEAQYHSRVEVTGVVEEKVERTPYTGTGTPDQIMFRLEGDPEERFVSGSLRAVDVEVGDEITLMCRQVWVYGGQSWSDCLWADRRVNE